MKIVIALLILFTSITVCNDPVETKIELPFNTTGKKIKPLRSLIDLNLQFRLMSKINKNKKWSRLIKEKKMAIGVVDLSDTSMIKFARINGNEMMYAASLPKIGILLASMDAFEKGELAETPELLHDIRIMIAKSDNQASTRMMERLGYEKISQVLTDPKYKFYDKKFGGGLWVGKKYAKTGSRFPEPILGLSHAATVSQVCRFYYMLAYGKLINYERSKQMLAVMGDPEIHHKFVSVIEKEDPNAKLYRKSGTWKDWHSDSILVWGDDWRRYILVALIEDPDGSKILKELVPIVEELLQKNLVSVNEVEDVDDFE